MVFSFARRRPSDPTYEQPDDDAHPQISRKQGTQLHHQHTQSTITTGGVSAWNKAHKESCQSLQSLVATSQQVLTHQMATTSADGVVEERPTPSDVVLWKEYDTAVTTVSNELVRRFQQEQPQDIDKQSETSLQSTVTPSWYSWMQQQILTAVVSSSRTSNDEPDWHQEEDDAIERETPVLDWEEPILNVSLAVDICYNILQSTTDTLPQVLFRKDLMNTIEDCSCCSTTDQMDFILQVLVHSGHATIQDDYIVLHDNVEDSKRIETALASFQIQQAIQSIERKIDDWTTMIQSSQEARKGKKQNVQLRELQKQKMCERHVESARSTLITLQQLQSTLETTTNQAETFQVLQLTKETWTNMNNDSATLDQVNEVMLDLEEAMTNSAEDLELKLDDDELSKELSALTLLESESDPFVATTTTEKQASQQTIKQPLLKPPTINETTGNKKHQRGNYTVQPCLLAS